MLLLVAGIVIVILVMLDAIRTTLTTRGAGRLTLLLTTGLRGITGALHRQLPHRRGLLVATGPLSLLLTGIAWIMGLWLGWCLIFAGMPGGIVEAQSGKPTNLAGMIYFVGFTLSTLGIGDLKAQGDLARIATSVAAFNGLILVTLGITYAVPLISGAVQRRKLAITIALIGSTPTILARKSWSGENFHTLELQLISFSDDLLQCAEQRLAYPVLDYFHSPGPEFSLGLQLAVLDEALSLLQFGVVPEQRPDPVVLSNARDAISHYLYRSARALKPIRAEIPGPPGLNGLEEVGLHCQPAADFTNALTPLSEHRRRLHKLVRYDGWEWSQVNEGQSTDR